MPIAKVHCRKCGEKITLDFGGMTYEQASAKLEELDRVPMECPGFHFELSNWRFFWRFDEALGQAYPEQHRTLLAA